jgi:hypothetical protein
MSENFIKILKIKGKDSNPKTTFEEIKKER